MSNKETAKQPSQGTEKNEIATAANVREQAFLARTLQAEDFLEKARQHREAEKEQMKDTTLMERLQMTDAPESAWRIEEAIGTSLQRLAEYDDQQLLVVTTGEDMYYNRQPHLMTAGEAREEVLNMRQGGDIFPGGVDSQLIVLDHDPTAYIQEQEAKIQENKDRLLADLEGLDDDDIVWYPNPAAHKFDYVSATAGELRKQAAEADWFALEEIGVYFPHIISTDPDFDPQIWQAVQNYEAEKNRDLAAEQFAQNTQEGVIKYRNQLLKQLEKLPDVSWIRLTYPDGATRECTVEQATHYLLLALPSQLVDTGLPLIEPIDVPEL